MEIRGEYQIANSREDVWLALIDPDVLKKCIPGCESMEKISDTEFAATVMAAIGPVRARFNTKVLLEDLDPPGSYTLVGESKAGAAGFGRGRANITLTENENGTRLNYTADFKVGGKLAQVGSRLVVGVTKKTADDFFGSFSRELDSGARRVETPAAGNGKIATKFWVAVAGVIVALLIWWFLLR